MLAGRSAVISCSNTAPETSSTTLTQTDDPVGGATMNRVSTPPVAMAKLAPCGQRRRTCAVVRDQVPAGVCAALEANADAVDGPDKGQRGGWGGLALSGRSGVGTTSDASQILHLAHGRNGAPDTPGNVVALAAAKTPHPPFEGFDVHLRRRHAVQYPGGTRRV